MLNTLLIIATNIMTLIVTQYITHMQKGAPLYKAFKNEPAHILDGQLSLHSNIMDDNVIKIHRTEYNYANNDNNLNSGNK